MSKMGQECCSSPAALLSGFLEITKKKKGKTGKSHQ